MQRNLPALLLKSPEIAAIRQFLRPNRTGENVLINIQGRLGGLFLQRADEQSGFNDSLTSSPTIPDPLHTPPVYLSSAPVVYFCSALDKALLYLSEARGVRCERSQHGLRSGTPAERVDRTATDEEHDCKQRSKHRFLDLIAGHRQEHTFRLSADSWMSRMCFSNVRKSSSMAGDKC